MSPHNTSQLGAATPLHPHPGVRPQTHHSRHIRVICVDDHAVLIEGLRAQFAIDGGIAIAGSLPDAGALLDEVARLRPDAVLMDVEMPGPDAFEIADRVHHMHPDVRILFLSAHIRDGFIEAAFRCGASGYFAKSDAPEDIVAGLRQAVASGGGEFVMGPSVRRHCQPVAPAGAAPSACPPPAPAVHAGSPPGPPTTPLGRLTPRELEVARLIGKGLSRVQIAEQLCRSPKTIDGHQARILTKLGLECRADLIRLAIREGLAEA